MEVTKTLFLVLFLNTLGGVSIAQEKIRNPFIMRERKHCENLAVYEMRRVNDPMIRRPVPRRISGHLIRRPVRRLVLHDPRLPLHLRLPINPSRPRPSIPSLVTRRVKRQTKIKSPPLKPAPPTSITLPDQGTGVLPTMINLPQTGFGARRHANKAEKHDMNSVSIPLIPNHNPNSGFLPEEPLSPGPNIKAQNKILSIPGNQMKVIQLVNVPVNPSKTRAPVSRQPMAPYKRVSCLTPGHVCGWERERNCRLPPCETIPACFLPRGPANKPGKCPTFMTKYLTETFSIRYCFDDSNCRGNQICCHGNGLLAGSACVNPVFDVPRNATRLIIT